MAPALASSADLSTSPAALVLGVQEWSPPAPESGAPALNLSADDKANAERRFRIIEPLLFPDRFASLWGECNGQKLAVVGRLAAEHPEAKARTIRAWVKNYKRHGMVGLVNRDRADKGICRSLNAAGKEEILALTIPKRGVFGALRVNEIYRAYEEERAWRDERIGRALDKEDSVKYARYLDMEGKLAEKARLPKVSCMTLRRFIQTIPEAVRTLARDGEEAYRNTQEIISHRALSEIAPLSFCVMDHRLLDVFTRVPIRGGWRVCRPWLTAALDMRSRMFLGWGLFEVPSSDSIAAVLKKVFIEHGVPANCYFDNGRDFRAEFLEGKRVSRQRSGPVGDLDSTWRGVLGTLGVRVTHALAYNARAKIIEPNFNRISNFDRTLPEWVGHRPSARPERLEELVKQHQAWERGERAESPFRTIQEMATLYDAAIRDINERPLQGEGMQKATVTGRGWMSPAECWDLLIGRVERRTVRTEDLRVVFTKRRELTVKHGEICATFGGEKFYYRIEGEPAQLMALNGRLVEVAFDPSALGQIAVYFRDRFIALANCVPLRRQGDDLFVEDEKTRRSARRELKKAIASVHQQIPVSSPEERLARRREVLPARFPTFATETPVELPAPVAEAAAARAKAAEPFDFDGAAPDIGITRQASTIDDEFRFFEDE